MAKLDEKQESGVAFITGVMGEKFGAAFRDAAVADRFGSDIPRMAASWAFHDAWQHQGIARKEKSIAIISALIAMRPTHLDAAGRRGGRGVRAGRVGRGHPTQPTRRGVSGPHGAGDACRHSATPPLTPLEQLDDTNLTQMVLT